MEMRQVRYFVQIYESGSLLKTSQNLFMSHQALSKALRTLELELGSPLFYRTPRGVTPTPYGQELYHASRPVIEEMNRLEMHMKECLRYNHGEIKVSVAAGCRFFNSKSVWDNFYHMCPQTIVSVREYTYRQSIALLKSNELDALIISDIEDYKEFFTYELKTYKRVALLKRNNPLAKKASLALEDLQYEPLALSINDFAYKNIMSKCKAIGAEPVDVHRVSDTLYMYEMCSKDHMTGITIEGYFTDFYLPRYPDLCTVPFKGEAFPYSVTLAARSDSKNLPMIALLAKYLYHYLN